MKCKTVFSEWCHRNTMTCKSGECRGSACDFYPGILEPCNCKVDSETATEEEMKQHCHVCCQSVGKPETCKSTGELFQYFKDDIHFYAGYEHIFSNVQCDFSC